MRFTRWLALAPLLTSATLCSAAAPRTGDMAPAYEVDGIPHMIVIDRTGHIVRINRGDDESGLDGIVADIDHALRAQHDDDAASMSSDRR